MCLGICWCGGAVGCDHRGISEDMVYLTDKSVEMHLLFLWQSLFLTSLISSSRTKGYASLDYEFDDYRPSDLVKLDILLAEMW